MENLQQLVLLVDEMVDEGIIINTDGENIENKIFFKEGQTGTTQESGSYFNVSVKCYSRCFHPRSLLSLKSLIFNKNITN